MSDLWRKSLESLRDRFAEHAGRHELYHLLVHASKTRTMELTDSGWGRVGQANKSVGDRPLPYAWWNWLDLPPDAIWKNDMGAAWDGTMPMRDDVSRPVESARHDVLYGRTDIDLGKFTSLASKASQLLRGVPDVVRKAAGVNLATESWQWALHEMGWERHAGLSLAAQRYTWTNDIPAAIDPDDAALVEIYRNMPGVTWPPDRWCSVLETDGRFPIDVFTASVEAIDLMLHLGASLSVDASQWVSRRDAAAIYGIQDYDITRGVDAGDITAESGERGARVLKSTVELFAVKKRQRGKVKKAKDEGEAAAEKDAAEAERQLRERQLREERRK